MFLAKSILLKHYENGNKKKYSQLVPGSTKCRTCAGKSTKRGFSKKGLARIKFFSCFRFLWISRRPGTLNWERVVFLPSKTLYRKCGSVSSPRTNASQMMPSSWCSLSSRVHCQANYLPSIFHHTNIFFFIISCKIIFL